MTYPDKLITKELCIVDDQGNTRIGMRVLNEMPLITLIDSAQQPRITAQLINDNLAEIRISNPEGNTRISLRLDRDDASIQVFDNARNLRLNMMLQDNSDIGIVSLHQRLENGNKRIIISVGDDGAMQVDAGDN